MVEIGDPSGIRTPVSALRTQRPATERKGRVRLVAGVRVERTTRGASNRRSTTELSRNRKAVGYRQQPRSGRCSVNRCCRLSMPMAAEVRLERTTSRLTGDCTASVLLRTCHSIGYGRWPWLALYRSFDQSPVGHVRRGFVNATSICQAFGSVLPIRPGSEPSRLTNAKRSRDGLEVCGQAATASLCRTAAARSYPALSGTPDQFRMKSAISAGASASKPTTSSIPASFGSAMVNPVDVIPITISFAWMPVWRRYSWSA
jgi:hypothetical protein